MKSVVTFLIFAIAFYVLHRLFVKMSLDDPYENSPETEGIITKITDSDTGQLRFYVTFTTSDGETVEGQSIYYSKTYGKYKKGDTVRVKYNVVSQNRVRIKLIDADIISCANSFVTASRVTLVTSCIFLLITIVRIVIQFR